MKKMMFILSVSILMIAGSVYTAGALGAADAKGVAVTEMPDKDPKAKATNETKGKACCTSDKSCKKEGSKCETAGKTEGKAGCCDKSKAEGSTQTTGSTESAKVERTGCPKTKCQ